MGDSTLPLMRDRGFRTAEVFLFCVNNPVGHSDPLGLVVGVYYHLVPISRARKKANHSNLRLYADCPEWIDAFFPKIKWEGTGRRRFVTLGAGPDQLPIVHRRPKLKSDLNRDEDLKPQRFHGEVLPPGQLSNDEFILLLLSIDERYLDNLPYKLYPKPPPAKGWNSNSYVTGLLKEALARYPAAPPIAYGWDNPAPLIGWTK